MAFVVLLNQVSQNITILRLTDEMACEITDKYHDDVEAWISDKGLEEQFSFDLSNCSYMYVEEMPEIFGCDVKTMQETKLSLFP